MYLVDSHCHLDDPRLNPLLPDLLLRAKNRGVSTFLTISTRLDTMPPLLKIAEGDPQIFATVGVHPHEVEEEGVPPVEALLAFAQDPKVVGLGETGLDYYYEHSPRDLQQQSFRNHIEAQKQTGLPLIVHVRDAEEDVLRILKEHGPLTGVIHCFSGSAAFAVAALDLGFYISISGIVTFPKAQDLRDIVKTVPLERLLVETDAPYLAPVPHRGRDNEPAFVVDTAIQVAALKGVDLETIAQQTSHNFFTLFSKAVRP